MTCGPYDRAKALIDGTVKPEGIDLEVILMSLAAANNAFFKGEIDYSAGLTGIAGAAVRGYPARILIFTVARPLQFFVSRKEIKEARERTCGCRVECCRGRHPASA